MGDFDGMYIPLDRYRVSGNGFELSMFEKWGATKSFPTHDGLGT
jgi:hypothetical protein